MGGVAGAGTLNYVAKWDPDGSTLGNSIIFDSGTNVGIGTTGPGAKLEVSGQIIGTGQTINGVSHYQWDGATYRNPADHTPSLLVREDNVTAGINGFKPTLSLYNNDGSVIPPLALAFVSREANGAGNAVNLAGIMAVKESAGTAGGWSQGGLNFFVKNMGTRVDAMYINNGGNVGIGTTGPGAKLDINSGGTTKMFLGVNTSNA